MNLVPLSSTVHVLWRPMSAVAVCRVGDAIRGFAGRGGFESPPGTTSTLTLAVVAGPMGRKISASVIGVGWDGPATLSHLDRQGHAWGPGHVQLDLEAAALDAAAAPSPALAIDRLTAAIRTCAVQAPALLTLDIDAVVLAPSCAPERHSQIYSPTPPPRF